MVELVTLLVVHLLKCFFAGSQLEQIVHSSSSCIYITACFRAGASVQDNTLYLAALLLLPYSLQSVGTWDGGGSGSTYQLRASCCSPPARLPGSWPHCCPLCLLSYLPMSGDIHKWAGRVLLLPFEKAACAPCVKRFGQWPKAGSWDATAILFGFSFSAWLCISLEDFPCTMLLSVSKTSSLPGSSLRLRSKFYMAWSYLFRLVPNSPL